MNHHAILALGGNLGDRAGYLAAAAAALHRLPGMCVLAASSLYETRPVGFTAQPDFLNAVVLVSTPLVPEALLGACQRIEHEQGRVREKANGPRTLDIDLLFYGREHRQTAQLTLPHPRYAERAFVCVPLGELLRLPPLSGDAAWDWLRRELEVLPASARDSGDCRLWSAFSF
ncbi:MAG: 2-amino-4-hydroxy-6-hydroxymethyldihydropteridine diphosphokinase [Puniceicoccales bacterium]|jgi:2-amino-4-hydroxy-6-hydroxymethyldihydropteridine diphosphokinase|nr:2-amino-4-hydroxy-6-hydroxymethyldihydropteridine diphosphokinase [Puniceicoccales bacterium]